MWTFTTSKTGNMDPKDVKFGHFSRSSPQTPLFSCPMQRHTFFRKIIFILNYLTQYLSFDSRDVMYLKYLTHFFPMFPFYTSFNHQETFGFLMYSCSIKGKQLKKPIEIYIVVRRVIYSSCSRIFQVIMRRSFGNYYLRLLLACRFYVYNI